MGQVFATFFPSDSLVKEYQFMMNDVKWDWDGSILCLGCYKLWL